MVKEAETGTRGTRLMVASASSGLNITIQALMAKIKDRARRKAALTDRKSAAAQARMKNIASLRSEERRVGKECNS